MNEIPRCVYVHIYIYKYITGPSFHYNDLITSITHNSDDGETLTVIIVITFV